MNESDTRAPKLGRRLFFGALGTALGAPLAPRRVYSFLWDNPLVETFDLDYAGLRDLYRGTGIWEGRSPALVALAASQREFFRLLYGP